jgi:hypothetical protein
MIDQSEWLSRNDAAEWLSEHGFPITPKTLANLAHARKGPPYEKWGKAVSYNTVDLMLWAEQRIERHNAA